MQRSRGSPDIQRRRKVKGKYDKLVPAAAAVGELRVSTLELWGKSISSFSSVTQNANEKKSSSYEEALTSGQTYEPWGK